MARSESMDQNNSYCFNVSTIYYINTQIKGLKSKPFKHFFRDQKLLSLFFLFFFIYFLFFLGGGGRGGINKRSYLSYDVYCNTLPMLTQD